MLLCVHDNYYLSFVFCINCINIHLDPQACTSHYSPWLTLWYWCPAEQILNPSYEYTSDCFENQQESTWTQSDKKISCLRQKSWAKLSKTILHLLLKWKLQPSLEKSYQKQHNVSLNCEKNTEYYNKMAHLDAHAIQLVPHHHAPAQAAARQPLIDVN